MKLIDKNIDVLKKNPIHWIRDTHLDATPVKFMGYDEQKNEVFLVNNQRVVVKDEFDEANKPNQYKRELIIALGLISINELKEIYNKMNNQSVLIIIEPNGGLFTYALNHKDLDFFNAPNVILFSDSIQYLPQFLDKLFDSTLIFYISNLKFYLSNYYRHHGADDCIRTIRSIKEIVKHRTLIVGNSTEDSLTGFRHNMHNIKQLAKSKDVDSLKNLFMNIPAIVVSAGPSLNKNINELKKIKNKAIIIAVDTIADRLCKEGIIPDFICSIEREKVTYTYFYENKTYPQETTLVGPLLLYPDIFKEYKGDVVIPMREKVGEFMWLKEILELNGDNSISIGISCAHVAFGLAEHIGAWPIVLMGQDLAYGNNDGESHAGGTIYDNNQLSSSLSSKKDAHTVEGYYGDEVFTTDIWISFRRWFEREISEKNLFVINATEGGAKIGGTTQMSLSEVGDKYCQTEVMPVKEVLNTISTYKITEKEIITILENQIVLFENVLETVQNQLSDIKELEIKGYYSKDKLTNILNKLQISDSVFTTIQSNYLLRHNLQPPLLTTIWKLFQIEERLTSENIENNRLLQIEFLTISEFVINKIIEIIKEAIKE